MDNKHAIQIYSAVILKSLLRHSIFLLLILGWVSTAHALGFSANYYLVVNITGHGTVKGGERSLINCSGTGGASATGCSETGNSIETLTATPAAGYTFTGWSGPCTGTGTCTVNLANLTAHTYLTANFSANTPVQYYYLVVNITGNGTVKGSGNSLINCSGTGGASVTGCYVAGNSIETLTATPAAGYTFTGWSGPCAGTGTCTVNLASLTAQTNLTANFSAGSGPSPNPTPSISAGQDSSFAIDANGKLLGWGNDVSGELGIGKLLKRVTPGRVSGAGNYVDVAPGGEFAIGLRADGTLWAWGNNTYGQLGDGTTQHRGEPVKVGSGYSAIATGYTHALALKPDGSLWAWGDNQFGQLGDNTTASRNTPVQVSSGYRSIASGSYTTVAVKTDGSLWTWGQNQYGELGNGQTSDWFAAHSTPQQIGSGYSRAFGGQYGGARLALKTDGSLWAWGRNSSGQLGDGATTDRLSPVKIGTGYTAISSGMQHTVALKSDGTLWAWGNNDAGQFGNGTKTIGANSNPQQVGSGYAYVSAGDSYTLAVKPDGSLWAWGRNLFEELGIGAGRDESCGGYATNGVHYDLLCRKTPVQIGSGYQSVAAGKGFSSSALLNMAIKRDGTLWSWGKNNFGQLGVQTNTHQVTPVTVGAGYREVATSSSSIDQGHTAAIKIDGSLWAWGSNLMGQLGDGTQSDASTPVQVGTGYAQVGVSGWFTVAVKTDGTLWSWGNNQFGQLGTPSRACSMGCAFPAPGLIGSGFSRVAAGSGYAVAIKTDGTLWGWGNNYSGQLGDGTTTNRNSPIKIGDGYSAVSAGGSHTLALKTDGTLWGWGHNDYGQLGDGTTTDRSSPVQIGSGYTAFAAGDRNSFALKADGTLWAWGNNDNGQLGDGTTTYRSSPVQIGNGFKAVSAGKNHAVAMKADGTVWSWGGNYFGQLGSGLLNNSSSPQLVVNEALDGILDIDPNTPNSIPSNAIPPFLAKATKLGDLSALFLSVDVHGLLNYANTLAGMAASGGYNLYVVRQGGIDGSFGWYQLDAGKNWGGLTWPVAPFMSEVTLSNNTDSVIAQILDGADVSRLVGSRIYLGYGTDAIEMVNAGRFREVMTITAPPK